jgi:hypothetical protein
VKKKKMENEKRGKIVVKRKALIFTVLFATLVFISIGCASAATIYVPDNFTTIQQAGDNETDNEIIIVRDGMYTENVDVNVNNLTIKSENGSALTTSATTVTLCSEASLDGYIRGDDLVDSTSSMLIIGDDNVNKSHRIFVSFNLSSIPSGATIDSANLRLYHLLLSAGFHPHDAYTDLGHVVVDHVDYGSPLAIDDYGIVALASNIGTISTFAGWGWRELDVTSLVQYDIDNGRPRSQYRLRYYPLETDGDGLYDQNAFASNETPYSPPELVITYSLPELPVRNIDTSEDFSTIQAAIDAVNTTNGHTITVDPRIYNENVNVYKQLTGKVHTIVYLFILNMDGSHHRVP